MMKQAYYKAPTDGYGWCHEPVELTGVCKTVTGGPYASDKPQKYFEVQRRLFGFKIFKSWFSEQSIEFFDPITETIHKCDCFE